MPCVSGDFPFLFPTSRNELVSRNSCRVSTYFAFRHGEVHLDNKRTRRIKELVRRRCQGNKEENAADCVKKKRRGETKTKAMDELTFEYMSLERNVLYLHFPWQ